MAARPPQGAEELQVSAESQPLAEPHLQSEVEPAEEQAASLPELLQRKGKEKPMQVPLLLQRQSEKSALREKSFD